jgi:enediyne biosynthesis protein E4
MDDLEPNLLFHNNHNGTFSERGVEAGIAYSNQGAPRAGMGVDTADTTNSGHESVLVGNNTQEGLGQFLSDGQGHFTDVADQTGLYQPSLPYLTFGVAFVDYDGDGFKDIITANGHVNQKAVSASGGFAMRLLAFHNDGTGKFREVGPQLGPVFQDRRVWRGLAIGDFDGDGDPDLLLSTCNGKPALLRNEGGNQNAWLQVKAVAAGRNREGLGTKVTVTAGGQRQTGWIRSGSSYGSQHELTAFFGLGAAAVAERVEARFPDGTRQTLSGVAADRRVSVREGGGRLARDDQAPSLKSRQPPLRKKEDISGTR